MPPTLDDLLQLPGNRAAYDKLVALIKNGEAIAFTGAGTSVPLYPLWPALIRRLAEHAMKLGRAAAEDRDFWLKWANQRPQQVVRGIREKLTDQYYLPFLVETFGTKPGPNGRMFTPVHGLIVETPFRGYVTTNYDPGLIEARHALLPHVVATGYATWKDDQAVSQWLTGDIFKTVQCPILHGHGIYQRPDTVVLGVGEYRETYRIGPYRRLFDRLWSQDHLIFVGFGFSDPWLDFLADEVLTQSAAAQSDPRHVAVLGLPEDERYTPEMRRMFVDQYDAEPLYYPVRKLEEGGEDHSALAVLLEALPKRSGEGLRPVATRPSAPQVDGRKRVERWVHETTNDAQFTGREDVLAKLDRWCNDGRVRVIGIAAIGGMGKTALIGHWLKKRHGAQKRPARGLFYWSFYAERDVRTFLEALVDFVKEKLPDVALPRSEDLVDVAVACLQQAPLLLVLDGLEVMQEGPTSMSYGTLLEESLRELLIAACGPDHEGLVVLTSRFPFADINPFVGDTFRQHELCHLSDEDGADLLKRLHVKGTEEERQEISRHLEGHPLGLRIFAEVLAKRYDGDPTHLCQHVFCASDGSAPGSLEAKLRRLLVFYEQSLPKRQVVLLGIVSLFATPVSEAIVLQLGQKLVPAKNVFGAQPEAITLELRRLRDNGLVIHDRNRDTDDYSCHPVLRDHFRRILLATGQGVATEVAGLLTAQPAGEMPADARELEPIVSAIEMLLEAGNFKQASEIYQARTGNGLWFLNLAAPDLGMRCSELFVRDEARRKECERQLSGRLLSDYLDATGLYAQLSGEFSVARAYFEASNDHFRADGHKLGLSMNLQNLALSLIDLGDFASAIDAAAEALALAKEVDEKGQKVYSLAFLGFAEVLSGHTGKGMEHFEEASILEKQTSPDGKDDLHSWRGIQFADCLIRLGDLSRARSLTERNLAICEQYRWGYDSAHCHAYLGRIDTLEGRFPEATAHFGQAEATYRRGHMIVNLTRLRLFQSDLHRRLKSWDDALHLVEEALRLAMPRGMRPVHADGLVLRGTISLDRATALPSTDPGRRPLIERALDDAEAALAVTKPCGYVWAERDAHALLASAHGALDQRQDALRSAKEAERLSHHLRLG
jgi:tetratricopeptide (TPR) repeat protein